ncbi:hypothetical protein C8F04DRAFT_1175219 [Mycena alexandri]|uniref:Uncharacterized protein n=1 Tax=Mycena alexandri TaxID=1745969 RepID=A0AAD6TH80_9AGAR|nr:hypothetical protein C8F04DRAFT_1175219 [Mycena alexandri]
MSSWNENWSWIGGGQRLCGELWREKKRKLRISSLCGHSREEVGERRGLAEENDAESPGKKTSANSTFYLCAGAVGRRSEKGREWPRQKMMRKGPERKQVQIPHFFGRAQSGGGRRKAGSGRELPGYCINDTLTATNTLQVMDYHFHYFVRLLHGVARWNGGNSVARAGWKEWAGTAGGNERRAGGGSERGRVGGNGGQERRGARAFVKCGP